MSEPKTYTEEEYNALQSKVDDFRTKVDEFRANNVSLLKKQDELSAKFEGIDVDKYNDMMSKQKQLDEKKLIDEGKIEELFEERSKSLQEKHVSELNKIKDENDKLTRQMGTLVIDNAVRDSAVKSGVVDTAIDDVLLRSQSVFSLKDGKATPHDKDGNVIYGNGSSEPMSIQEWVESQKATAPHLFKPSNGGGSSHGGRVSATQSNLSALDKIKSGL